MVIESTEVDKALEYIRECLDRMVLNEYSIFIDDFLQFLKRLIEEFQKAPQEVQEKVALNINYLLSRSKSYNVIRAIKNAFYAYLVYVNRITVYKAMKYKMVSGAESIYSWLRVYQLLKVPQK